MNIIINGSAKFLSNAFGSIVNAGLTGLTYSLVDKALMAIAKRNFGEGFDQKILDEKQKSKLYYSIKAVAIVSAISVSCLLAPQSIFISCTALKAFEVLALAFAVASSSNLIYKYSCRVSEGESVFAKDPDSVLAFLGAMALIGYTRPPVVALGGAVGLIVGIVRNKIAEDRDGPW